MMHPAGPDIDWPLRWHGRQFRSLQFQGIS